MNIKILYIHTPRTQQYCMEEWDILRLQGGSSLDLYELVVYLDSRQTGKD